MTRRGRASNALFVGAVTCGLLGTGLVGLGAYAIETAPAASCIPGSPGNGPTHATSAIEGVAFPDVDAPEPTVTDASGALPFCADLPACTAPYPEPVATPAAPATPEVPEPTTRPSARDGEREDDDDDDGRRRHRDRDRDRDDDGDDDDDDDDEPGKSRKDTQPDVIGVVTPDVTPGNNLPQAGADPTAALPLGCTDAPECVEPAPPVGDPTRPITDPLPDQTAAPDEPAATEGQPAPTPAPVVVTADVPPTEMPPDRTAPDRTPPAAAPVSVETPVPAPVAADLPVPVETPVTTVVPPAPADHCVPRPTCDLRGDGGTAPSEPAEPAVLEDESIGEGETAEGGTGKVETAGTDKIPPTAEAGTRQPATDTLVIHAPAAEPAPAEGAQDEGAQPDNPEADGAQADGTESHADESDGASGECEAPPAVPAEEPLPEAVPGEDGSGTGGDAEPTPAREPDPTPKPATEPTPKPTVAPEPAPALQKGGPINRAQMIARATSWVVQKVPYSQVRWWSDKNGRYRQDCSGMVSMAWNLSQKTNYWTGNLAKVSHRIPSKSLEPGDILLWPTHHTLIFTGWANADKTRFNLMEQYRSGKPARYALNASLSYYLNRGFGAFRYDNVVDSVVPPIRLKLTAGGSTLTDDITLATAAQPVPNLAGLPAEQWTEETADDWTDESAAPAAEPGMTTPDGIGDIPVDNLVAQQLAMDKAAARAAFLMQEPGHEEGSMAGPLIAAGLGLLFLAFPLGMGARTPVRVPQRK